ncbi:MAG: hypothetical protein M3362_06050 [Acidobacteriota bacterium]|nr:hypothetical protein [Acidobacteriota bacterium]
MATIVPFMAEAENSGFIERFCFFGLFQETASIRRSVTLRGIGQSI